MKVNKPEIDLSNIYCTARLQPPRAMQTKRNISVSGAYRLRSGCG